MLYNTDTITPAIKPIFRAFIKMYKNTGLYQQNA